MYDFEKLLDDYEIDHKPQNSRGWIAVQCAYCCNDGKYHGAFHPDKNFYACYKCGNHNLWDAVKIFTNQIWGNIQLKYKTNLDSRDLYLLGATDMIERPTRLKLPEGTTDLNAQAKKYLIKRRFDPEELEEKYGIKSTGFTGVYNYRIVFPIAFENKLVSYTCRDWTGKSQVRYLSCPGDQEVTPHKHIVYGFDNVPNSKVIVVEGIFDKLRLGDSAVALFGSSYTSQQVNLLASFEKVILLFDNEDEAQAKADKLGGLLSGLGTEVEIIRLTEVKDPDSLSNDEARSLVKQLLS